MVGTQPTKVCYNTILTTFLRAFWGTSHGGCIKRFAVILSIETVHGRDTKQHNTHTISKRIARGRLSKMIDEDEKLCFCNGIQ